MNLSIVTKADGVPGAATYIQGNFEDSLSRSERPVQKPPYFSPTQARKPPWKDGAHDLPWTTGELQSNNCDSKLGSENQLLHIHQVIKACGKQRDLQKGNMLHAEILESGLLKKDISLGNALLSMYIKCGSMKEAEALFDELSSRNVVTWNALITGYAKLGLGDKALMCYERMQDEGLSPNAVTFICILKACGSIEAYERGVEIHMEVCRRGLLGKDTMLGTTLVDMYAKCGAFAKAQEVLDKLPARDVATWTALIAGYAQHGCGHEALSCFQCMQDEGLSPNAVTYICLLKACGCIGAADKGKIIHAEVKSQRLLEKDIVLGNALVDMYAKCGLMEKAQEVFNELPTRNIATWNALISGYVHTGLGFEALSTYEQMQEEYILPDAVTLSCILEACGSVGAADKGEEIHAQVGREGLLEKDNVLGTALVDMYVKCGMLEKAQKVLDGLPARNVATWTSLIAGYAEHGFGEKALSCLGRMRDEGFSPNSVTFLSVLKACSSIGTMKKVEEIHAEVRSQGLLQKDLVLGTTLVDMYGKCGLLAKAQHVFDELPERDVASWTALMAGFVQHGLCDEAISCFQRMQDEGFPPNEITYSCIFKACSIIGAAQKGEEVHLEASMRGLLDKDTMLGSSLVDMYAKCGVLTKAQEVFDLLPVRQVSSWNALMGGYAQVGKTKTVFSSLVKMIREGMEPTMITFVVILTACSHAGLVEEGQQYFQTLSSVYCITPTVEHWACMVDIFCRAGLLDKAMGMLERVPPSLGLLLLPTIIGACKNWANVEMTRWVCENSVQVDEKSAAGYVCTSNLFAAAGVQMEED